jgi:hypothetical protein
VIDKECGEGTECGDGTECGEGIEASILVAVGIELSLTDDVK